MTERILGLELDIEAALAMHNSSFSNWLRIPSSSYKEHRDKHTQTHIRIYIYIYKKVVKAEHIWH